ncbi:hypothetical protein FHS10_000142 [Mucilaginibacter dorajii]|nr:hypothetical protein [Mucilaginibacter dorajii]
MRTNFTFQEANSNIKKYIIRVGANRTISMIELMRFDSNIFIESYGSVDI